MNLKPIDVEILSVVEKYPDGITSKDVNEVLDGRGIERGRNTVNAELNLLHEAGHVFYLAKKHGKVRIYLHDRYRNNYTVKDRHDKPIPQTKWERAARLWREVAESDTVTPELYRQALKEFEAAEK